MGGERERNEKKEKKREGMPGMLPLSRDRFILRLLRGRKELKLG